jgi:hypothetical protein
MPTFPFDVAGPEVFVFLGGAAVVGVLLAVGVVIIEAVVLTLFKWSRFWRALLASFVMNLVSTVVGVFVIGLALTVGAPAWLLLTFVASVVLEGGVIFLMNRPKARIGLLAVLVANVVTYLPLGALALLSGAFN